MTKSDTIGTRIAKKRKEKKLSQAQLAEKIHVSQSEIAKFETNERPITADRLADLCNVLDTNADYITRGCDTKNVDIIDDLHLCNEAVNNLREYLGSDALMQLDNTKEAVNFFLSSRNGYSIISQLYAYLNADCSNVIYKGNHVPSNDLKIPLKGNKTIDNVSVSYHLSDEDFSEMLIQKILFNLKNWRKELHQ